MAGRQGAGTALVSALGDSGQSLLGGAWVLAGQSTGYDEGGSSDNGPQVAASVCISDAQGRMEPLTRRRRAGREGEDGHYCLPLSPPVNPSLMWARTRQAVGPLAGRQALPNSHSLPRPPRVPWEWLHPSGHPSKWSPRQQVLTAPGAFHPATVDQAKGQRHADPGPDTWRSVRFPGQHASGAVSATPGSGTARG